MDSSLSRRRALGHGSSLAGVVALATAPPPFLLALRILSGRISPFLSNHEISYLVIFLSLEILSFFFFLEVYLYIYLSVLLA